MHCIPRPDSSPGRAFTVTYLTAAETIPDELLAVLERYLAHISCY